MADRSGESVRQRRKAPAATPAKTTEEDDKKAEQPTTPFLVHPLYAFGIFLASHLLAAYFQPIQDCDEVFNYWEATHYLTHGHGFETWEYAPMFGIRSWAYAGLHALNTLSTKFLTFGNKTAEFYLLRAGFALVCAVCETSLYAKISGILNPRTGVLFLGIMATAPGMFHASISYLPSSFSMYTTMLSTALFMDWRKGLNTTPAFGIAGAGACLGWPFAGAMAFPFLLEEFVLAVRNGMPNGIFSAFRYGAGEAWNEFMVRMEEGTMVIACVLVPQVAIDCLFYRGFLLVPFNIVYYNLLSVGGGPNIYGTETWDFYFRNLLLNFHVWFLLALLALPLMLVERSLRSTPGTRSSSHRGIVFLSPFYLWLAIFTLQPHKEERFMYPAYPALALNASVALHTILAFIGSTNPKDVISKIPLQLRFAAILTFVAGSLALSVFRTVGTITAYDAPLSIYKPLHSAHIAHPGDTVCLGKEWYRFPSHFLLPEGVRAKFIKSEFRGLLPGEFYESSANETLGIYPATYMVPPGMNPYNEEDPGKYTELRHCTFLVDSNLPSTKVTKYEPNYIADTEHWERVKCLRFMDSAATGTLGRIGWIPNLPFIPEKYRRVYGDYCLLKRKKIQIAGIKIDAMPKIEMLG